MCVYLCFTSGEEKRNEDDHEKGKPEEEEDAEMGFKWAFHILLDHSCSDKVGQPKDIYGSLEGGNHWQEREKQTTFISDDLSDS